MKPRTNNVFVNHLLELSEGGRIDVQLPFEMMTHSPVHIADLSQLEHSLDDNQPQFVGVVYDFLTDDLCKHKGRYGEW
jgi:hypothetical protein